MKLRLLYFAWLRTRIGAAAETLDVPAEAATPATLIPFLARLSPGHAAAFARPEALRCAINQEFAAPSARIAEGDEVAFFPPVTGG